MSLTREANLELDGTTISFEEHPGAGPAVVGLHGMSFSRAAEDDCGYFDWSPITAAGRRLVRYDARGHGRSTGRPTAWRGRAEHAAKPSTRCLGHS